MWPPAVLELLQELSFRHPSATTYITYAPVTSVPQPQPSLSQVLELLTEHLSQWSTSISFPELSHLPCVVLRGFAKGCAVERFRRQARQLVDALERNAVYVGNARDAVNFAPQDLAAAAAFLSGEKERAQVGVGVQCAVGVGRGAVGLEKGVGN